MTLYIYIWANYNISLTWIKAIWGWFPLVTMIPGFGRSEVVIIYPDISRIYWIYIRINQQGILNTADSAKRLVIFVRFAVASIVGYDNPHLPCGVPKIGKLMVHTTTVTGIYGGFMVDISTAFYGFTNQKTWLGPLKEVFFQHLFNIYG